jgi:RimJ/RimL family protein N-acetyltransferase
MEIFLETERLLLRRLTEADLDHLYALDSDPEVVRYINDGAPPDYEVLREQTLPRFLSYYEKYEGYGFWAAIEEATGEFLGWFHFRPATDGSDEIELGYRLKRSAWSRGYATEGARALIRKGFRELGVKRVVAMALAANTASINVMKKVGLRFEKTFIENRFPGQNKEAVKYALDAVDFDAGSDSAA